MVVVVPREKQLQDAIARALSGNTESLDALLRRHSNFPSQKPNLVFADEVVATLSARPADAMRIAKGLLAHHPGIAPGGTESEFLPLTGLLIAVGVVAGPTEKIPGKRPKASADFRQTMAWLHEASDDMRFHVRDACVLGLGRLMANHEPEVWDASLEFMDGYFSAATVLRMLKDRKVTDGVTEVDAVLAALEHALSLLLNASRSDVRYPGYKELLAAVVPAWTLLASRFGSPVLETLLVAARSPSPAIHETALKIARDVHVRGRFPESCKRIEAARHEAPVRIDPRNERLKKRSRF